MIVIVREEGLEMRCEGNECEGQVCKRAKKDLHGLASNMVWR